MFEVILLQICLIGAPTCATLTDKWGPYKTIEICEQRIDALLDIVTKGIETYGYRAFCAEVNENGAPIGEWEQYVREGDSMKKPKLGDPI